MNIQIYDFEVTAYDWLVVFQDYETGEFTVFHNDNEGVVNFVTYKRNLPGMRFSSNVRVVGYQGVLYPTAYTCASVAGGSTYPDYRQTAYWHPLVNLKPNEPRQLQCLLPGYPGAFRVVVEGLTEDGTPVRSTARISVR